jgi:hypothetical protein
MPGAGAGRFGFKNRDQSGVFFKREVVGHGEACVVYLYRLDQSPKKGGALRMEQFPTLCSGYFSNGILRA